MEMSEGNYNKIVEDLTHMAEIGSEYYLDSLAVMYIIMRKLGDRNADMWIGEMKEQGFPIEWESLRDGKKRNFSDIEKAIKNFVGICVFKNGNLSFKDKLYKYSIKSRLAKMVLDVEENRNFIEMADVYRLTSLYTLSGDDKGVVVLIIGDETYKKLPLYVQWIEKYMWR